MTILADAFVVFLSPFTWMLVFIAICSVGTV